MRLATYSRPALARIYSDPLEQRPEAAHFLCKVPLMIEKEQSRDGGPVQCFSPPPYCPDTANQQELGVPISTIEYIIDIRVADVAKSRAYRVHPWPTRDLLAPGPHHQWARSLWISADHFPTRLYRQRGLSLMTRPPIA